MKIPRAKILAPTLENLKLVSVALKNDEIVGMPTETVYGLAANARSPLAVARIFEAKSRPYFDPLIVHVGAEGNCVSALAKMKLIDPEKLSHEQLIQIDQMITKFWPGPLTLILPKHTDIPDLVCSGLPHVGLRMPTHPIAQSLIHFAEFPLAAPSANRFGKVSPTSAEAVQEELGEKIDWILDGGACNIGLESTIVAFNSESKIEILRPGKVTQSDLENLLRVPILSRRTNAAHAIHPFKERESQGRGPLESPGLLESHYAPSKPFYLLPLSMNPLMSPTLSLVDHLRLNTPFPLRGKKAGFLLQSSHLEEWVKKVSGELNVSLELRVLSETGDLVESAQNLFRLIRELDSCEVEIIFAEPCESTQGLGMAIQDRLARATANSRKNSQ